MGLSPKLVASDAQAKGASVNESSVMMVEFSIEQKLRAVQEWLEAWFETCRSCIEGVPRGYGGDGKELSNSHLSRFVGGTEKCYCPGVKEVLRFLGSQVVPEDKMPECFRFPEEDGWWQAR